MTIAFTGVSFPVNVLDPGEPMPAWIVTEEPTVRLAAFFAVFSTLALLERVDRWRPLTLPKGRRWLANLGLTALNTGLLRVAFPILAVGVARVAEERGWGLLNVLGLPDVASAIATVLVLDLAIYFQHRVFHHVPVLWRLHAMHHADLDLDVTTGARFHPIEIALSMGIKMALVVALGASVAGVIVFEILLNATSMFNHSDIRLPEWLDKPLRMVVVTPDMHRVHHSVIRQEHDTNFGFNLPWWDRIFRTYQARPGAGMDRLEIGLDGLDRNLVQSLWWLLVFPFRGVPRGDSRSATVSSRNET